MPWEHRDSGWAESWGLWLLGHRSVLRLTAPAAQRAELDLKLYLPYDQQQVSLNLNGTAIFQTTRQPTAVGEFSSRLLVQLVKGPNTLTITSSKSSRDGFNVPFAPKDASDLSVALSQLEFRARSRAGGRAVRAAARQLSEEHLRLGG